MMRSCYGGGGRRGGLVGGLSTAGVGQSDSEGSLLLLVEGAKREGASDGGCLLVLFGSRWVR